MLREACQSSNIKSFGYDQDQQILEVEFVGGSMYQYLDVSQDIYDSFLLADSKGKFFYQNIRNQYRFQKV